MSLTEIALSVTKSHLGQVPSIGQLLQIGKAIGVIFLAFLWVNLYLIGPIWAPKLFRIVYGFNQQIRHIFGAFMRGYGPQIAARARDVAGLRNRLSFLWNTERVHRAQVHQEGGFVPPSRQSVPITSGVVRDRLFGQFTFVCMFVAGSVFGGLIIAGSLCLGIWVGRLLSTGNWCVSFNGRGSSADENGSHT